MTANEIADELEKRTDQYLYYGFYNKEAASILRQQVTKIEELKLENKLLRWTLLDIRNMARLTKIPEKATDK
jgi:hypothetical protein